MYITYMHEEASWKHDRYRSPSGRLMAYSFCLTVQPYFCRVYIINVYFPFGKDVLFTSVNTVNVPQ